MYSCDIITDVQLINSKTLRANNSSDINHSTLYLTTMNVYSYVSLKLSGDQRQKLLFTNF